jgi:nucleotide-binding universal stress UspA family protein
MKTILVPVGGGESDDLVLETALAVAQPLAAHLEFLHVHVGAGEAALHTPHAAFARGQALRNTLDDLKQQASERAAAAARNVRKLCVRSNIEMREEPGAAEAVTARWLQEEGDALGRLMFHARHNDLVVMARPTGSDGLPRGRLESLLMACARPILIASQRARKPLLGTVMVCWKEAVDAARALSAALPLLAKAQRVVLVAIGESAEAPVEALAAVARQLRWHGVEAETRALSTDGRSAAELLAATARECGATLVVMGGYGHRPTRELMFGGCTQAAIDGADTPIFIVH